MATLIGDIVSDPSRFRHSIIAASPGLSYQPQSQHPPSLSSRPRDVPSRQPSASASAAIDSPSRAPPSSSTPSPTSSTSSASSTAYSSSARHDTQTRTERTSSAASASAPASTAAAAAAAAVASTVADKQAASSASGGASRFPSPPDSSSPSGSTSRSGEDIAGPQHGKPAAYMEPSPAAHRSTPQPSSRHAPTVAAAPTTSIPSPPSEAADRWSMPSSHNDLTASPSQPQKTVHIRDLAHIQSLARTDMIPGADGRGILDDQPLQAMKYEISGMPIGDIIEMVAALLTKITTTNDLQHDALNRNANHVRQAQQAQQDGAAGGNGECQQMSPLSSSVLAFHGKNVPAITILSYLSRIHKYCPTTYEVFLSLLVYFDRMTERVNDIAIKAEEAPPLSRDVEMRDANDDDDDDDESEHALDDEDLADDSSDEEEDGAAAAPSRRGARTQATTAPPLPVTFFVVDSFNIHRLIIAGVTCSSKFFSDVFYTNSRYAKVGGLPLAELNHLELQFLLLNDFRLAIPVEDLEAYATMLVEFYAREVVADRSRPSSSTD